MAQMIRAASAALLLAAPALADDPQSTRSVLREALPASVSNIHRVGAAQTPSGFAVPRFVSLKFGRVNARTGPSRQHAIAFQYQRRGLPLVVVAETEMWRKVRDISGDEAWVRKPALSGERRAIALSDTLVRRRPSQSAGGVARLAKGAVVDLGDCEAGFCRVQTEGGLKGFAPRAALWGAQDLG